VTAVSHQGRRSKALTVLVAAGCVALQVSGRLELAFAATVLWLVTVAAGDRAALGRLAMPRFWTITVLLALASGLLLGPRDLDVLGLRLSARGLQAGALMTCRGAFIFALACWVSRALDGAATARLARRVGLGELGVAVASAWSVLPTLTDRLRARRAEAKGPRRWNVRRLRGLAVEILLETARLAERLSATREDAGRAGLVLVVGAPGTGKTAVVADLAARLDARGLAVGGVIQPAIEGQKRRAGYDLRDLSTSRRRAFARRTAAGPGFTFDEEGWLWAAESLARSQRQDDVVVVDELGLLESIGEGHLPALLALGEGRGRAAVLVATVRAGCDGAIAAALGEPATTLHAPLDGEALDEATDLIAAEVERRRGAAPPPAPPSEAPVR